jgi:membrane protease YdiL (CAAX protease family)
MRGEWPYSETDMLRVPLRVTEFLASSVTVPTEARADEESHSFNVRALVSFFFLSYALSWAWVIPFAATGRTVFEGRGWPTHFPSLLGPMLAAFVGTAWTMGRGGVRDLLRRMVRWRIGWRWWLIALSPVAFLGLALGGMAAAGKSLPNSGDFAQYSGLSTGLGVVGVALVIVVIDGFGEETGWRGYGLAQLQKRFSPLVATLILAGCWAGWHIPSFFALHSYKGFSAVTGIGFVFGLACGAVVATWLYNRTGGSILAVAVWHGMASTTPPQGPRPLQAVPERSPRWSPH